MAIYNLGSINIDHVYRVPHLPQPGETLKASDLVTVLGGKGANQSIAAARAGAKVFHIGAYGAQDPWIFQTISGAGVDTQYLRAVSGPSGHAIICVDAQAENSIVLFGGANQQITPDQLDTALADAGTGDWLLLQNETNLGAYAARKAKALGLQVCYSAAPFDTSLVAAILPFTDLLIVNEVEEREINEAGAKFAERLGQIAVVTTFGSKGARCAAPDCQHDAAAFPVRAVDTTGAGDTFLGYLLAAVDRRDGIEAAMQYAMAAAAVKVSRAGTSTAIPTRAEVEQFLASRC
jgi:ribokinase